MIEAEIAPENLFESVSQQVIKEVLVCPLLPHILMDPVCCNSCEAHFCRVCLERALKNNARCPLCRQDIDQPKPAQKYLKRILENSILICGNRERGCDEKIKYNDFLNHNSNCPYEELKCPNYLCGKTLLKKDFPSHKNYCDSEKIECEYCKKYFLRDELLKHVNKRECSDSCKHCKKLLLKGLLHSHEMNCDSMVIFCNFCQKKFFRANFDSHRFQCVPIIGFNGYLPSYAMPLIGNNMVYGPPKFYASMPENGHQPGFYGPPPETNNMRVGQYPSHANTAPLNNPDFRHNSTGPSRMIQQQQGNNSNSFGNLRISNPNYQAADAQTSSPYLNSRGTTSNNNNQNNNNNNSNNNIRNNISFGSTTPNSMPSGFQQTHPTFSAYLNNAPSNVGGQPQNYILGNGASADGMSNAAVSHFQMQAGPSGMQAGRSGHPLTHQQQRMQGVSEVPILVIRK